VKTEHLKKFYYYAKEFSAWPKGGAVRDKEGKDHAGKIVSKNPKKKKRSRDEFGRLIATPKEEKKTVVERVFKMVCYILTSLIQPHT
jgi:hypothetical protein